MLKIIICVNNLYDDDVIGGLSLYVRSRKPKAEIIFHTDDPTKMQAEIGKIEKNSKCLAILSEFDDTYEIAKDIRQTLRNSYIIFVSRNKPFLEEMTNMNLMLSGFITHPFLDETFTNVLDRVLDYYKGLDLNKNEILVVTDGATTYHLRLEDILYISSGDKKVKYVTSGKIYYNRNTLAQLEQQLGKEFMRVHNSYIVNVFQIKEVQYSENIIVMNEYKVLEKTKKKKGITDKYIEVEEEKVVAGEHIYISREKKKALKALFEQIRRKD